MMTDGSTVEGAVGDVLHDHRDAERPWEIGPDRSPEDGFVNVEDA